jgi:squalene-associated FAD-dependent desaturase
VAALNTPPEQASARNFIHTLRDSFAGDADHTDLLFSRQSLGRLFARPAMEYIEQHGGHVKLSQRIDTLQINGNSMFGLQHADGEIHSKQVILATPHQRTHDLLAPHQVLYDISDALARITSQPICTVYLQYPAQTRLAAAMQGLIGTVSQWVFDRRLCDQPGLMAVVISAEGPHMKLDNTSLAELVSDELAHQYPHWPAPEHSLVIREKRATFACRTGIDALRPANRTPVRGLWLAGDYTNTGYPATLEGALRSGVQCASEILTAQEED